MVYQEMTIDDYRHLKKLAKRYGYGALCQVIKLDNETLEAVTRRKGTIIRVNLKTEVVEEYFKLQHRWIDAKWMC